MKIRTSEFLPGDLILGYYGTIAEDPDEDNTMLGTLRDQPWLILSALPMDTDFEFTLIRMLTAEGVETVSDGWLARRWWEVERKVL